MAMTPQAWSISALAVELGVDRRTVAAAITEAGVAPVGREAGSPRYRMRDVLGALARGGRRGAGRSNLPALDAETDHTFRLLEAALFDRAARLGLVDPAEADRLARAALGEGGEGEEADGEEADVDPEAEDDAEDPIAE